jgi:hypothetical protein
VLLYDGFLWGIHVSVYKILKGHQLRSLLWRGLGLVFIFGTGVEAGKLSSRLMLLPSPCKISDVLLHDMTCVTGLADQDILAILNIAV